MFENAKILLVNDFEKGGGAEKVFNQTYELLTKKCIVDKFVGEAEHSKLKNIFCSLSELSSKALGRVYSFRNYTRLLDVLYKFKPDVIHLQNFYSSLSPSILKAIGNYRKNGYKIKVIFTAHDYHLLCPYSSFMFYSLFSNKVNYLTAPPDLAQSIFYKWDSRGFPFSFVKKIQWINAYFINNYHKEIDHIITPSFFLADLFHSKFHDIPVAVVRNPFVNSTQPDLPVRTLDKSRTLNLVYIGRLSPEKGLLEFIQKLSQVDTINYIFKIIGDGQLKGAILKIIEEHNLKDNVLLLGEMKHQDVLKELSSNDALVLPSLWYENAPLSLVEGAFMNLRLITANYGGMKEIAELCGGAYLMEPTDFASVRDAIVTCYNDIINGEPVMNRDFNMLGKLFSKENYIDSLLNVYESTKAR